MHSVKYDKYNFKIFDLSKDYGFSKIKIYFVINENVKILKSKVMNYIRKVTSKYKCDHIGTTYKNNKLTQMFFLISNQYLTLLNKEFEYPIEITFDINEEICNFNCFQFTYENVITEKKQKININMKLV